MGHLIMKVVGHETEVTKLSQNNHSFFAVWVAMFLCHNIVKLAHYTIIVASSPGSFPAFQC